MQTLKPNFVCPELEKIPKMFYSHICSTYTRVTLNVNDEYET